MKFWKIELVLKSIFIPTKLTIYANEKVIQVMEPSLQNCFVTFIARSKEFCGFSTNWKFWNSIFSKIIKKENLHVLVKKKYSLKPRK